MQRINAYMNRHPELFTALPAAEVHPHDHLMARTVLRLFPRFVTPNQVTLFRVCATPLVFLLILYGYYHWGVVAFLFVAFTDAIDGSMARTRNQVTRFGALFDPLADKFLIGSMVFLLVFRVNAWLATAVLGFEIILIMTALVAKYKFKTVRMANIWGKVKMILQVVAVFVTLLGLVLGNPELIHAATWIFGIALGFAVLSLFAHGV